MKKNYNGQKVALVFGKFAPLHKGHQMLIEKALAAAGRVIVMVYDRTDITSIPVKVRAGWIRSLYPNVSVVEVPAGPPDSNDDQKIMRRHVEFIESHLPEPVTHVFSGEWYGDHLAKALGARSMNVDAKRRIFPVSGTLVRESPRKYKKFLDPMVYDDVLKYSAARERGGPEKDRAGGSFGR